MKIAYHYTSKENWDSIKKHGLVLYDIDMNRGLGLPHFVKGVWLWPAIHIGRDLLGTLIWQMSTKNTHNLVELEVEYDPSKQVKINDGLLMITHSGDVGKYIYHDGLKSIIYAEDILVSNIRLTREWDLTKSIK